MKKFLLSVTVIVASIGYALYQSTGASAAPATASSAASILMQNAAAVTVQNAQPSSAPPTPTQTAPAPTPVPTPAPKSTGQYADGTYTGSTVDVYYGYVQVQAVISGGKIANVAFLQYPSDRSTSRYINSQAMPYLIQEALQTQNANVNTISGASETSRGFRASLAAALAQA